MNHYLTHLKERILLDGINRYNKTIHTKSVDFVPKYHPPFKKILPFVVPFSKTANLAAKIIIVRQPGSYTLHGKLKFFFRWILYHWDLYNAYPADNKRVSLS